MATAAAIHPVDRLADTAVSSLGSGDSFVTKTSIPIPSGKQAAAAAPAGTATDYVFPLESQPFSDLNAYLVSGIKLPKDNAAFELDYPRALLEPYTNKESETFYSKIVDVLTGIHQHCFDFKTGTMSDSVKLGGSIADFADEATKASETLAKSLKTIIQPGARSDDPAVVDAFTSFSTAMTSLRSRARASQKGCEDAYKGFDKVS
jgi:hypothetical protein